jgi:hypothetical protein
MPVRCFLPALIVSLLVPAAAHASSNPIPGVGIVIKCPCGGSSGSFIEAHCCTKKAIQLVGGFFGPGSAPVDQIIDMEGRCANACNGCADECPADPDGRIDYASDGPAGPFEMILPSTVLYSRQPIQVDMGGGVLQSYDVIVTLSGLGSPPGSPFHGVLSLPSGASLDVGTSSQVETSSIDLHSTMTFVDASTGDPSGSAVEEDLHLDVHDPLQPPLARVADGTPGGRIVLGSDGSSVAIFSYTSPNDELTILMQSLYDFSPTGVVGRSWGAVKTIYR